MYRNPHGERPESEEVLKRANGSTPGLLRKHQLPELVNILGASQRAWATTRSK
jgi:hypothetical protein